MDMGKYTQADIERIKAKMRAIENILESTTKEKEKETKRIELKNLQYELDSILKK